MRGRKYHATTMPRPTRSPIRLTDCNKLSFPGFQTDAQRSLLILIRMIDCGHNREPINWVGQILECVGKAFFYPVRMKLLGKEFRMSSRSLIVIVGLMAAVMISVPAAGQQVSANWAPSRTAWGDPDLQGVYTFATQTPVERPTELGGKAVYTQAELADLGKRAEAARKAREEAPVDPAKPPGGYDAVWTASERGRLTGHTSLIVDPEDGRMPALTPRAQKIRADIEAEEA